jgi:hypothetical protein
MASKKTDYRVLLSALSLECTFAMCTDEPSSLVR